MAARRFRRWLFASFALGPVLVGTAIALWVILHAYAPALTREQIESRLSRALEGPVRVGKVVLHPWRRRLDLLDVTLGGASGRTTEPFLRLGRATIRLVLSSLWHPELVISRIAAEGARRGLGLLRLGLVQGRRRPSPRGIVVRAGWPAAMPAFGVELYRPDANQCGRNVS